MTKRDLMLAELKAMKLIHTRPDLKTIVDTIPGMEDFLYKEPYREQIAIGLYTDKIMERENK